MVLNRNTSHSPPPPILPSNCSPIAMCFCLTFLALEASCLWSFMRLAVCELSSSCLLGKIIGNMSWSLTISQQISINLIILFVITECLHFFFGLIFKAKISVHVFLKRKHRFNLLMVSNCYKLQVPANSMAYKYGLHIPSPFSTLTVPWLFIGCHSTYTD